MPFPLLPSSGAALRMGGTPDDEAVAGPDAVVSGDPITMVLAGAPSGEVVPGPAYLDVTAEPPDPVNPQSPLRVRHVPSGVYLHRDRQRTWTDPLNAAGHGEFVLQADDPQLADLGADVRLCFYDGPRPCFPITVDHLSTHVVAEGEEAAQTVKVSGPGLVDQWRQMLVYPDLGSEQPERLAPPSPENRVFNYAASTGMDSDHWPLAVATSPRYGYWDQRFTQPDGWPDTLAQWIWDRSCNEYVPPGTCYFRTKFRLPAGVKRVRVYVAADDDYELFFDGVKVLSRNGFYTGQAESYEFDVGADFHLIAAAVHNRWGRGGFLFSMLPVTSLGTLGTPIRRSDQTWRVLGYKKPPVWTIGKIIRTLLDEANRRGTLSGWNLRFTDKVDSHGDPWPALDDYTVRVGLDGLALLAQLAEAEIDFAVSRSGARYLYAWRQGKRGHTTGVSFTAGTNLVDLGVEAQS